MWVALSDALDDDSAKFAENATPLTRRQMIAAALAMTLLTPWQESYFMTSGELRQDTGKTRKPAWRAWIGRQYDRVVEHRLFKAALDQLCAEGFAVLDEGVARLSPLGHDPINMLGRYSFAGISHQGELRPLSPTDSDAYPELSVLLLLKPPYSSSGAGH